MALSHHPSSYRNYISIPNSQSLPETVTAKFHDHDTTGTPASTTTHRQQLHANPQYLTANMSKGRGGVDQMVKLIVGAGGATPSPPIGPALGSRGVKSIDFCKVRSSWGPSYRGTRPIVARSV